MTRLFKDKKLIPLFLVAFLCAAVVIGSIVSAITVKADTAITEENFFTLPAEQQIATYNAMDGETAYRVVKASDYSWCVTSYDKVTPENIKDFVIIYEKNDGTTAFNLCWPIYGGYKPASIASIKDLSGKVDVARVGGDGGYCISYGKNPEGSWYTVSQMSVPVSATKITTGVMNVDLYKKTAEIVTGDGTDEEKIEAIKNLGIDEENAEKMISDYRAWLERPEVSGKNNIQDGIASVGNTVEPDYGYYGITSPWKVSNLTLEGGSGQMNTIYSWGTLKSSGIVTDLGTAEIN